MLDQILDLTTKLISIKSTDENRKALDEALEFALSELQDYTIERFEKNGYKSALVYNVSKRPSKFSIVLNAHLDVTPAKEYQFKPKVENGKLYGAGALDMKANAACLIMVFKEIAKNVNYPLALQLTTDEEIGGFNGTKYQIEEGVSADFVIAGETTNFDIVTKSKGILQVKITAKGKTAHSAYPWKGDNAILRMNDFLNKLTKQYPTPKKDAWVTTVSPSRIQTTNYTLNKIPDECTLFLDIRYIPEDKETIVTTIKNMLSEEFEIGILMQEPAKSVSENDKYIQSLKNVAEKVLKKKITLRGAHGSSDARHFTQVGCIGIEFGSIGEGIGSDEEWINIHSLEQYSEILKGFLNYFNS